MGEVSLVFFEANTEVRQDLLFRLFPGLLTEGVDMQAFQSLEAPDLQLQSSGPALTSAWEPKTPPQSGTPKGQQGKEVYGDLSDVPAQRLKEVKGIIKSIRDLWRSGRVGSVSHLREWIDTLQRLSGLSRQVCLQLCVAMSRCLAAERKDEKPSRVDLQLAFVRMGGSRHACHMMMLRLDDANIVTHVVRLLAASVENAPLAAEALQRDNLDNVKLIMRSMERHVASAEVSEAGCLLIGHLCSGTAAKSGDLRPVRVKAHRDCQNSLCREGAMETIVDILTLHMKEVRSCANKAHMMMQEKVKEAEIKRQRQEEVELGLVRERAPVNTFSSAKLGLKDRIMKVQANLELRAAWQKLVDKEVMGGRVMNAALQALLLLVVGNSGALRQLSGNFFAYHMNKLLDLGEEFLDAAKEAKEEKDMRRGKRKPSTEAESESEFEDGKNKPPPRMRNKMGKVEVPTGPERQAMGSLESLSLKCQVLVDALRGHAAKDRPAIVVKTCRLFLLIFEHHKALVQKANDQGRNRCRHVELKLRNTVVAEDRQFDEIFKHMASMKTALISALRTHSENSPVISAVFSVLARLRELALLSAPAGMPVAGSEAEKHWQAALVQAGGEDTEWIVRQAATRLRRALEETKKGDHRIETQGLKPQELQGNGEWLTPRLREEVRNMIEVAEGLGADAFKARWAEAEEPDRWNAIYRKQQQLAAQAKYREDKIKAKELGITYEEFHRRELAEIAEREAAEDESSSSGISGFTGDAEEVGEVVVEEEELNFEEEDVFGQQQWVRAIGFGQHDEEDFDRVWRKPFTDAFMRALPERAPPGSVWAIEAAQRRREIIEQAEKSGEPLEDPDMDELLQIEMLESLQGKLKIRALVRAQDQIQANIIEGRDAKGNELLDPAETSKSIIHEVSKGFKKQGYMIPKYGFTVRLQKRAAGHPGGSAEVSADPHRLPSEALCELHAMSKAPSQRDAEQNSELERKGPWPVMKPLTFEALSAEFVGTFVVAFTVGCTTLSGIQLDWASVSIAAVSMVMMYAFGPISGGHLNPSISISMFLIGKLRGVTTCAYILAQVCAAILALLAVRQLFEEVPAIVPKVGSSWTQACLVELMYTAMLDFVVLCVYSRRNNPDQEPNQFYGLACGFALVAGIGASQMSGGVFNPAVALGIGAVSKDAGPLMYLGYQLLASLVAAVLFRILRPEEYVDLATFQSYEPSDAIKYASEFIGTFLVVVTYGLSGVRTTPETCSWTTATALMSLVYAVGDLSGGHFNPAVTTAVVLSRTRRLSVTQLLTYWVVQVAAGLLAALACVGLEPGRRWSVEPQEKYTAGGAYIVEFTFTLLLCMTFLSVSCVKGITSSFQRNFYFGLAIGLAVLAGSLCSASISGGCLNPAVSVGVGVAAMMQSRSYAGYYIPNYVLAQLLGGIGATVIFATTHAKVYASKAAARIPFSVAA
ncbi:glpF6 [Symbiodinium natans]|uniref:GlpF6 protein n=1 Tax=Symbiodinium natans TaxID=878477 RepID=A0A812K5V9_9DINO|nr:glpF6 [Symbiodinium natans]